METTNVRPSASTVPTTALSSGRTVRDPRLDFYRGIAMFIILIAHTPDNFFNAWIPARWGFSDATEIFVFCSGMASAIAFGRTFENRGWILGSARVVFRVWQVYWAHIGMFFVIAMLMALLDSGGLFERRYVNSLNLVPFFEYTPQNIVGLFTLTYVPNYFDILPMYLVILAMMPVVLGLAKIRIALAFAAIFATWLLAQWHFLEGFGLGHLALSLPAEPWSDRSWFFNPFGWQLIFFTGFALMRGWLSPPPVNAWLIGLATFVVVINIPFSNIGVRELGLQWALEWRFSNQSWFFKSDFGPLRYLHFLSLAYLGWVVAGDGGHRLIVKSTAAGARAWAGAIRVITKVGQQSLAVFVFSMVFAQINGFALDQVGRSTSNVVLANLVGFAALIMVAYVVGWIKSQPWRATARR